VATETLYPDSVLANTGDYTVSLTTVDEAPDGTWTGNTNTQGITTRFSFPTPSGTPNTGAGLQTLRAYAQIVGTGNGDPTIQIELYEAGSLVTTQTATTVQNNAGAAWYSLSWDAADLTTGDGSNVEVLVTIVTGGGGPNENSLQLDSVEWTVDYSAAAATLDGQTETGTIGSLPVGAVSADGQTEAGTQGKMYFGYAAEVIADSPIAYWRLGETSGTTAVDEVGTNDGTYVGSPTLGATGLLAGESDTAVDFAPSDSDYVEVADSPAISPTAALTLEAWVEFDALPVTYPRIIAKDDTAGQSYQLLVEASTSKPFFRVKDSTDTTWHGGVFDTALNAGEAYHLVGTFDGTTLRAYVNGTQEATTYSFTGAVNDGATVLRFGRHGNLSGSYWDGRIDEVAIYDSALSSTRVQAHYDAGASTAVTPDGQTETGSIGTLSVGSVSADGQSEVGTQGTLSVGAVSADGQVEAGTQGTLSTSASLTGQSEVGTVGALGVGAVAPVGLIEAGVVGTLGVGAVTPVGQTEAGTIGTLAASIPLDGQVEAGTQGTLTVGAVQPTGQSEVGQVGTLTVVAGANVTPTGAVAFGRVGNVIVWGPVIPVPGTDWTGVGPNPGTSWAGVDPDQDTGWTGVTPSPSDPWSDITPAPGTTWTREVA